MEARGVCPVPLVWPKWSLLICALHHIDIYKMEARGVCPVPKGLAKMIIHFGRMMVRQLLTSSQPLTSMGRPQSTSSIYGQTKVIKSLKA